MNRRVGPNGSRGLPPFSDIPSRKKTWNRLALLSQERARSEAGEAKEEAIGQIDKEILALLREENLGALCLELWSGRDRTQAKITRAVRDLGDLVDELGVLEGTVGWLMEAGRVPYEPLYPS